MVAPLDLHGRQFGRWDVVSRAASAASGGTRWNCICQCGKRAAVFTSSLTRGLSTQCHSCANTRVWMNRKVARKPSERVAKWERSKEVKRLRWRRYRMYKAARAEFLLAGVDHDAAVVMARNKVKEAIGYSGEEPEMLRLGKLYSAPPRAELFDLSGQTFGKWSVLERRKATSQSSMWLCQCSCGRTRRAIESNALRAGRTRQCLLCQGDAVKKRWAGWRLSQESTSPKLEAT